MTTDVLPLPKVRRWRRPPKQLIYLALRVLLDAIYAVSSVIYAVHGDIVGYILAPFFFVMLPLDWWFLRHEIEFWLNDEPPIHEPRKHEGTRLLMTVGAGFLIFPGAWLG